MQTIDQLISVIRARTQVNSPAYFGALAPQAGNTAWLQGANVAILADPLGYIKAFNMLEGFEGEANAQKQRTLINGWKYAKLPWSN